ncbi:Ergosterol biosynthesis ERG4/ERG24 family [Nesidiocoris tenuis]|uniref:Ergosterol biosynthesis ERG4/ERG24 family n=1 Tax=Nesidiocoris tenuis TaxID=355587 RepID=A0ABN7ALE1_9HEMI|nr:Ergosterol biosynthesis ERG4/ERG24 family [Nesidiocoris tenuis]
MNREARSSKPSGGSKKSPSRTRSSSRSRKTKPKEKTPEPKVRSKSKTRRSPSRSRGRPRKRTSTSPDVVTNSIQNVVESIRNSISPDKIDEVIRASLSRFEDVANDVVSAVKTRSSARLREKSENEVKPAAPKENNVHGAKPVKKEFGHWIVALAVVLVAPVAVFAAQLACTSASCPPVPTQVSLKWRALFDLKIAGGYLGFLVSQMVLAALPLGLSLGTLGRPDNHKYRANGLASIIVTAAVLIGVKLYTTFPIVKLLDMSLPILTTSILTAIVLSVALYVKAVYQKTANHDYGKTGNVLYDIFAGAEVNPRVGPLDVKTALLRTALITTIIYNSLLIYKEVDGKGLAQISVNAVLVAALQIVFSLDFVIFESDLLSSFTVNQDGTGLLLLLHGALFPFWITLLPKYLYLSRTPHNVWLSSIAGVVFLIGYIIHRISNHQKRKVKKDSSAVPSKDVIHSRSSVLYKGGLWGLVRHPNYLGALIIYSSWSVLALAAAPVHWIPVAISVVNLVEIATQIARVESRSEERHGAIWNSYAAQVKYRILPRVF